MVGRIVRKGTGAFLVVLAAMLAVLVAVATPAWADTTNTTSGDTPATSASDLADKLGIDKQQYVTGDTITIPAGTEINGTIYVAPSENIIIKVEGNLTITSPGAGFLIGGSGSVTFTGSGTITTKCTNTDDKKFPAIQVGYQKDSPEQLKGSPAVTIAMGDGSIVAGEGAGNAVNAQGGTVDLASGTLIGGKAGTDYGAIYVGGGGTFTMQEGTRVESEGDTAITTSDSGSKVTIQGGTVEGYVESWDSGEVTMNGRTVTGSVNSEDGANSTFNFNGGRVDGDLGQGVKTDPDKVKVQVTQGQDTYYLVGGNDVASQVPEGSKVTVEQAPADADLVVQVGVTVENTTQSEIKVNGEGLASNASVTVQAETPAAPESPTIVPDGETFPKTGDSTLSVAAAIAALGLGIFATALLVRREAR